MENKKICLDIEKIKSVDLSHLIDKISRVDMKPSINWPPGISYYKLLSNIAGQLNNSLIIDLGTHHGLSCLALSTNPNNRIISYDVTSHKFGCKLPDNVERRVGNIFDMKEESILLDSDFIYLDTNHTGDFELQVYEYLRDNNYSGFIIFDDIHFNKPMQEFWKNIPDDIKTDITYMGHGKDPGAPSGITGTGLVDFNDIVKVEEEETKKDTDMIQTSDWIFDDDNKNDIV